MPVLALDDDREQATQVVEAEIGTAIREDSINSVVLGCASMVHITDNKFKLTRTAALTEWRHLLSA